MVSARESKKESPLPASTKKHLYNDINFARENATVHKNVTFAAGCRIMQKKIGYGF